MTPLNKVFTFAISTDAAGPLTLLFADLKKTGLFDAETMLKIAQDPILRQMMPDGAIIVNNETEEYAQVLVTTDIGKHAINRLETPDKTETIVLFDPENGLRVLNLHEIYYQCNAPHKLIMGCPNCTATLKTCEVKKIALAYCDGNEPSSWTPEDVKENCKNRKTMIADFTYISPKLTMPDLSYSSISSWRDRHDTFGKTYRTVSQHDFTQINTHAQSISRGAQERERYKRFRNTACPQCFVKSVCNKPRYCKGPFLYNEETAAQTILQQCNIPFTDSQLAYLLHHSGPLEKKYNRCDYWLTPRIKYPKTLSFCLSRRTESDRIPLTSFDEAQKIIKEYDKEQIPLTTRISDPDKAVLIELSSRNHSPYYYGGGMCSVRTVYGIVGITYYAPRRFKMNFRNRRRFGQIPNWLRTDINTLEDVFRHYRSFEYLQQTRHSDAHVGSHY